MTVHERSHPRVRDWWTYRCDECGQLFGSEPNWPSRGEQTCYHCHRPSVYLCVGNPHPPVFRSDMQFHGEHYRG